jgi:hypothetical protein
MQYSAIILSQSLMNYCLKILPASLYASHARQQQTTNNKQQTTNNRETEDNAERYSVDTVLIRFHTVLYY